VARYGQAYKDRIVARLLPPEAIKLRNPTTGHTAQCGPYTQKSMSDETAMREARCLDDFEKQGFVRVP
jgi:hypothetical protein